MHPCQTRQIFGLLMWNSCLGNVLFAREGPGQSCSDFWMSRVQAANALLSSAPCLFYNQQSSPAQSCVSHLKAWCIAHKVQLITGCVAQLIWCRSEKHHSAAGSPENNASLCISALGRVGKIYCLQIMRMGEVVSWGMGWRQGAWGMSSSGVTWVFPLASSNWDESESLCLPTQSWSCARAEPLCDAASSQHWGIYKMPLEMGWRGHKETCKDFCSVHQYLKGVERKRHFQKNNFSSPVS